MAELSGSDAFVQPSANVVTILKEPVARNALSFHKVKSMGDQLSRVRVHATIELSLNALFGCGIKNKPHWQSIKQILGHKERANTRSLHTCVPTRNVRVPASTNAFRR
jgi:hypothetical protein